MATLETLYAVDGEQPVSANPTATLDRRTAGNTAPLVLDFGAASAEFMDFGVFMPRNYAGSGVDVVIGNGATTAVNGAVVWEVAFMSAATQEVSGASFGTAKSVIASAAASAGVIVYTTVAFSNGVEMDGVQAGEYFRLQIHRETSSASDNMSGDAEFVILEIKDT